MTACGGKAENTSTSQQASVDQASHSIAPAVESTAMQEASASDAVLDAASDNQEVPEPVAYELPLTETPATFTVYTTAAPGFMSPYLGPDGSYNSAESTRNFAELTGVNLQYIEIDMMSFSQNFNLMIASGGITPT